MDILTKILWIVVLALFWIAILPDEARKPTYTRGNDLQETPVVDNSVNHVDN